MAFAKNHLSGAADGLGIKVVATATLGTTIHTGPSTVTSFDEVYIWAMNSHTASVLLTVEYGGATSPDYVVQVTIPAKSGPVLVIPGWVIQGNASPLVVTAFAATGNVVTLNGYINNITA